MRALFTGSFDPVTNGHLNLIQRAVSLVDTLVVVVSVNPGKQPIFSQEERVAMLQEACREWPNVEIRAFEGLVVEAARQFGASLILRGLRDGVELAQEMQMAQVNRALTGIETLFLPASPQWAFISSSMVKEVVRFGGDITPFVPKAVAERLNEKLQSRNS